MSLTRHTAASIHVVMLHVRTHIEFTHADMHACKNRGTHPASRSELICAVHVRCSQRPSCRQTTQHNVTQWLICPMKNEQAGLQSAHCAPLNVSTSSHSLCLSFSHNVAFPFASFFITFLFSFPLSVSPFFLILSIPVTFLSASRINFLSPSWHLEASNALADEHRYIHE